MEGSFIAMSRIVRKFPQILLDFLKILINYIKMLIKMLINIY